MTDAQSFALAFGSIALLVGAYLALLERRSRRLQRQVEELRRRP
ncbi:MAG: hypothetical protein QOD77_657 [Thermoplasmata archaeon]|jgi:hypothetical protein|nr:hypothetical protein [Thermoplasmata archaeon]